MNKRLKEMANLAAGEFVASMAFVFAFVMLNRNTPFGIASWTAFCFLIILLWQGSAYWRIRIRWLRRKKPVPHQTVSWFVFLRKLNLAFCIVLPLVFLILSRNGTDLLIASGLYLFAVIEYVNYYWYRLSYGKSGFNVVKLVRSGLKKSSLHKLIDKNR